MDDQDCCETCFHWAELTWKCIHPENPFKINETAYPTDHCFKHESK